MNERGPQVLRGQQTVGVPEQALRTFGRAGARKILLLDDHEIVRQGLRSLLETQPDVEVVTEASTAAEALVGIPASGTGCRLFGFQVGDADRRRPR